ncbi:hypothetical protein [Nostoc sp. C052]|nr:hypothetical protein [Nostoc sp. C052]
MNKRNPGQATFAAVVSPSCHLIEVKEIDWQSRLMPSVWGAKQP